MFNTTLPDFEYYNTPSVNQENQNPKFSLWAEDTFTQPDLVSTEDNQIQELIHRIRYSFVDDQEALADKLVKLFNYAKEERPNSPGISVESLNSFYEFLLLCKNIKIPTLSLTDDHNIYASWRKPGYVFSVHFLPDESIRFVLFMPNTRHPNRKIRMSGSTTADMLMEVVPLESLMGWVIRER